MFGKDSRRKARVISAALGRSVKGQAFHATGCANHINTRLKHFSFSVAPCYSNCRSCNLVLVLTTLFYALIVCLQLISVSLSPQDIQHNLTHTETSWPGFMQQIFFQIVESLGLTQDKADDMIMT